MMGKTFRHSFIAAMSFLFLFMIAGVVETRAIAIFGVTDANVLVRFDSATPGTLVTIGPITGLQGTESILGIDFRPATGELYALGGSNRLYVINTATGAATQRGAALTTAVGSVDVGFDFNPVPDRIRIVTSTGQNLRVNPNDGSVIVDGPLNPGTPQITAAAYNQNFNGTTTTTLFAIDSGTDSLFTQNPPNNGTLVPVGPLGVNIGAVNGFDYTSATDIAYLVATPAVGIGNPTLYTVNTTTGAATAVGPVGGVGNLTAIRGIAVEIGSIRGLQAFGLTTTNTLVSFNTARPNVLLSTAAITGTQGENLIGIDFRPANGRLYVAGATGRIYIVNPATGAATFTSQISVALTGTDFGFDFNPVPDRLRVVSDADQNLRIDVTTGIATVDGPLAYAAGDPNAGQNPNIVSAAYTNNFAGTTSTLLRVIDSNLDIIASQDPPNNGTLNTLGSLGVNTTANVGYDFAGASNSAVLTLQVGGDNISKLFSVSGSGGFVRATFVGPIGAATALRGVAVTPGSAATNASLDYDGDRRSDYAVFRPSNRINYINNSANNTFSFIAFGLPGDTLTPGDYDGDGRTDLSVWRNTTGVFFVLRSSDFSVQTYQFGINGDEPVARDYDGDRRTDFAVVRRTGGRMIWYVNNSSNNSFRIEQFGLDTDVTAPGDYDGDGRFDLAVFRGTGDNPATFFVNGSLTGFTARQFGLGGDRVVPGDYDGDGRTDFAVVRMGTQYMWFVLRSSDGGFTQTNLGTKPHLPTQGDYDGDGRTDVSVWDPITGGFYVVRSSTGVQTYYGFGQNGDLPIANYDTH